MQVAPSVFTEVAHVGAQKVRLPSHSTQVVPWRHCEVPVHEIVVPSGQSSEAEQGVTSSTTLFPTSDVPGTDAASEVSGPAAWLRTTTHQPTANITRTPLTISTFLIRFHPFSHVFHVFLSF